MTTISVIICVYTMERWDELVAAVKSAQQQNTPPLEIIVVVDHHPLLLQRVRAHLPEVVAVANQEPQGLSGARNSGIAVARGSLIAFLDDDATANPDWLTHFSASCEDPDVLGVGGVVEPHWLGKRPSWFPEEFYWVVGCSYKGLPQTLTPVRNPYGGCTCIRREVFATIGGFKNEMGRRGGRPLGGEETELSIRARQYWPWRTFLYEPRARIQHRISPQRGRFRYFLSRCYAEGLSKAAISRSVGISDGLASERAYALHTLPQGVARGVRDGFAHFDLASFQRAGAIIAGLAMTASGYLVGTISQLPYDDLALVQVLSRRKGRVGTGHTPYRLPC